MLNKEGQFALGAKIPKKFLNRKWKLSLDLLMHKCHTVSFNAFDLSTHDLLLLRNLQESFSLKQYLWRSAHEKKVDLLQPNFCA